MRPSPTEICCEMARITLVNPPVLSHIQGHRLGHGHLGLGYIASSLLKAGHDVRAIDAKKEGLTADQVVARLTGWPPDLLGVTAMTHEIHSAVAVCALAKRAMPEVLTMVGGPHATALPERTIEEFAAIDIAVIGEGEHTACAIAAAVTQPVAALAMVDGIAFRGGGKVVRTPDRPWITDLDNLPFPAWHLFPWMSWPLLAGRGCPFGCKFCQRVLGRKVRMRSVGNVLAEIDAMDTELGLRSSWFSDETFALNRKWANEFLTGLEERNRRQGYVWRWKANSRANLADATLYRRMRAAGCHALDFGVESGSAEILRRISKSITKEMAIKAIRAAKESGLTTNAFFIIGHPGETKRTAFETVRFAGRLGADDIAVGVMVPYPGTEIWQMANDGQYNYRLLTTDWRLYDKYFGNALEITGLSHREMEFFQVLTYVWFYLKQGHYVRLFTFIRKFRHEAMVMLRRLLFVGSGKRQTAVRSS